MGRSSMEIDWEAVERDYRINTLTIRQQATKHCIDPASITRRAKRGGWSRDLSEAVAAATKAKVRQAVIQHAQNAHTERAQAVFSEVDLAASVNATIIVGQQRRVGRLNALLEKMVAEVEAVTGDTKTLTEIAKALEDADPAAAEAVSQLRSLRNRVTTLKDASAVAAALNQEERKIFRLDDDKSVADNSIESLLRAMKADPLSMAVDP